MGEQVHVEKFTIKNRWTEKEKSPIWVYLNRIFLICFSFSFFVFHSINCLIAYLLTSCLFVQIIYFQRFLALNSSLPSFLFSFFFSDVVSRFKPFQVLHQLKSSMKRKNIFIISSVTPFEYKNKRAQTKTKELVLL